VSLSNGSGTFGLTPGLPYDTSGFAVRSYNALWPLSFASGREWQPPADRMEKNETTTPLSYKIVRAPLVLGFRLLFLREVRRINEDDSW
jgi:hypothetical protein